MVLMQFGSIIAVFFVIWWLTFVAVLPIGTASHHETGVKIVAGGDPGSPVATRMLFKLALTTVLAVALTALLLWGLSNETLSAYWNR
jgi:predicted secreted protein